MAQQQPKVLSYIPGEWKVTCSGVWAKNIMGTQEESLSPPLRPKLPSMLQPLGFIHSCVCALLSPPSGIHISCWAHTYNPG